MHETEALLPEVQFLKQQENLYSTSKEIFLEIHVIFFKIIVYTFNNFCDEGLSYLFLLGKKVILQLHWWKNFRYI